MEEGEEERFSVLYRGPRKDDERHHLLINRSSPKLEMDISTSPQGLSVWMQGGGVETNNGRPTGGKYPVKWTLPGEVRDERTLEIISKVLENIHSSTRTYDGRADKSVNSDIIERVRAGMMKILPHRGLMDEKKEIPAEFWELAPDSWLKRGLKGVRRDDTSERKSTGAANWMLDVQTSIFFANVRDPRDRIDDAAFEQIMTMVINDKLSMTDADRELRAKNQLQVHIDVKTGVHSCFEEGLLPEKIWGYKHWQKMIPHFETLLVNGVTTSKKLGTLLAADKDAEGKEIYLPVLATHVEQIKGWPAIHPERVAMRDKFFELLTKWPKTQEMGQLLNDAFNYGVPMEMIVERNITRRRPMEELIALARVARMHERQIYGLTEKYEEPPIDLKDQKMNLKENWRIANHKTFPRLGTYYDCCIADSGLYESTMVEGKAFIVYLEDLITPTEKGPFNKEEEIRRSYQEIGRGALVYCEHDGDKWQISQMKSWHNHQVHPQYATEAKKIVSYMNEHHRHAMPRMKIEENEKSEHPIDNYVIDKKRWVNALAEVRNSMDFRPEQLDKMLGVEKKRAMKIAQKHDVGMGGGR